MPRGKLSRYVHFLLMLLIVLMISVGRADLRMRPPNGNALVFETPFRKRDNRVCGDIGISKEGAFQSALCCDGGLENAAPCSTELGKEDQDQDHDQEQRNIPLVRAAFFPIPSLSMNTQRIGTWVVTMSLLLATAIALFGNGGAWQTGVPLTGNTAATDQKKSTNVTIEDEKLTIDLHQEFAAVEVRYRMRNTGEQVEQDFFFPLEKWAKTVTSDAEYPPTDLDSYKIAVDGTTLKATEVDAKGDEKPKAVVDAAWGEFEPATKVWKKLRIPFSKNQTREVVIEYRSKYAGAESSVSDDFHATDVVFEYALSPAATWKGPIGKGKITVNLLHPRPEEVVIAKPANRFKKINETRFEWEFSDLKPTLADDLKIVAHPAFDIYQVHRDAPDPEQRQYEADYIFQGDRYFLQHTDYDATASSTLKPNGERTYDVNNIRAKYSDKAWVEGVEGDGIGESITLKVRRPLPLDTILIMPGYHSQENKTLWGKNNRVAEMEVTLNDEHTFTVKIPDERFAKDYPIPIRDYAKPVNTVKLTIKGVHKGTAARDTCISSLALRGRLSEKPTITHAR